MDLIVLTLMRGTVNPTLLREDFALTVTKSNPRACG
jgi:hypothetical protein